jgi:hypothetical protein
MLMLHRQKSITEVSPVASKAPVVSSGKVAEASTATAKTASTTKTKKCGRTGHEKGASAYSYAKHLALLSIIRDISVCIQFFQVK